MRLGWLYDLSGPSSLIHNKWLSLIHRRPPLQVLWWVGIQGKQCASSPSTPILPLHHFQLTHGGLTKGKENSPALPMHEHLQAHMSCKQQPAELRLRRAGETLAMCLLVCRKCSESLLQQPMGNTPPCHHWVPFPPGEDLSHTFHERCFHSKRGHEWHFNES